MPWSDDDSAVKHDFKSEVSYIYIYIYRERERGERERVENSAYLNRYI